MSRVRFSLAVVAALGVAQGVASAQDAAKPAPPRQIDVAVTFSFQLPIKGEDGEALAALSEDGRRMAYAMSGRECASLLKTIASTCRLERVNVTSNQQSRGSGGDGLHVTANAAYRIEPKGQ